MLNIEKNMFRKICLAICLAILIVYLSNIFYYIGGEFLLQVGRIGTFIIQVFFLLFSGNENTWLVISKQGFTILNVIIYGLVIFTLLTIIQKIKERKRK